MAIPLVCDSCGADLQPDDVDLASMAGVCRRCNHVVDLDYALRGRRRTHGTTPERDMAQVRPPKGVQVYNQAAGLAITRRWYQPSVWLLALFCLVWDGFLVVWYTGALFALSEEPVALLALLFPIFHLGVGVYLTWTALATFLNTTFIEVRSGRLTVRHGPIWWPAPDPIEIQMLGQLYTTALDNPKTPHALYAKYELHVQERDGVTQRLLGGLPNRETARYIERRIESYLEVVDRPVEGELPR